MLCRLTVSKKTFALIIFEAFKEDEISLRLSSSSLSLRSVSIKIWPDASTSFFLLLNFDEMLLLVIELLSLLLLLMFILYLIFSPFTEFGSKLTILVLAASITDE